MPKTILFKKVEKLITYFLVSGIIEGCITLLFVLLTPADPKNAWFLGYSQSRVLLLSVLFAITLSFVFIWRILQSKETFKRALTQKTIRCLDLLGYSLPIFIVILGLLIFGSYIPVFRSFTKFDTLYASLFRLLPVFIFGLARSLQLGIVLWIVKREQNKRPQEKSSNVVLSPSKISFISAGIATTLILISGLLDLGRVIKSKRMFRDAYRLFGLSEEANIPTFFSTLILLFAAALLFSIAVHKRKNGDQFSFQWTFLSGLFFILALDETSSIHEKMIQEIRGTFNASGLFHFSWVIAAIPFVIILGLYLLRFILSLPKTTKTLFVLSATLFVTGAIGLEMLGGLIVDELTDAHYLYWFVASLEEVLEISGVIVFNHALLKYLVNYSPILQIQFQ
jgi:hypothetical protein